MDRRNFLSLITMVGTAIVSGGVIVDSLITRITEKKGLEYHADYSAKFKDRSLIDKGYADCPPYHPACKCYRLTSNIKISPELAKMLKHG